MEVKNKFQGSQEKKQPPPPPKQNAQINGKHTFFLLL